MALQVDELVAWKGRDLFDASGRRIGSIVGPGYARRKFGTAWLLLEITDAKTVLVPADQIHVSGDRLVLPYPKTYVEDAPNIEEGRSPSRAEERRLCLHYGLDSAMPNSGCRQGCGLCMAKKRADAVKKVDQVRCSRG